MPRQQELSDADAVSFLLQPDELSDEDAVAFLTAPEQGGLPDPRQEPPQDFATPLPLASFTGRALEGLSSLAGLGRIASEKVSGALGLPEEAPFFSGLESGLSGLAQEAYPEAQRGTGGFLSEDLPGGAGSMFGAAPGIAGGPVAAAITFGAQTGVPLYYEVKEKTGDEEAATWALLGGAAIGQFERFGAERYLGGVISKLSKGKLGQALKDAALAWALGGPQEAATEWTQQYLADTLQEELTGEELDKIQRANSVLPVAFTLGTGMGALHSAATRAATKPKGEVRPTPAQPAQKGKTIAEVESMPPQAAQGPLGAQQAQVAPEAAQPPIVAPEAAQAAQEGEPARELIETARSVRSIQERVQDEYQLHTKSIEELEALEKEILSEEERLGIRELEKRMSKAEEEGTLDEFRASLTPEQEGFLFFSEGTKYPQLEHLRDVRNAVADAHAARTPQELSNSIKYRMGELSALLEDKGAASRSLEDNEVRALAVYREAEQRANLKGWDFGEVMKLAARDYAGRFSDPADAADMLSGFLKRAEQTRGQEPDVEPPKKALRAPPKLLRATEPQPRQALKQKLEEDMAAPEIGTPEKPAEPKQLTELFAGPPLKLGGLPVGKIKAKLKDWIARAGPTHAPKAAKRALEISKGFSEAEMSEVSDRAKALDKAVSKLHGKSWQGKPIAQELDAAFEDPAKLAALPDELKRPLSLMRGHLDQMIREQVRTGAVDPQSELAQIVLGSTGKYSKREYRAFNDLKWAEKVDPATKQRFADMLIKEGKTPDEAAGITEAILQEAKEAAGNPWQFLASSKLGSKNLSIYKRRKQVPEELKALLGEIKDPIANYANSVMRIAGVIARHKAYTEIKTSGLKEGWLSTEKPTEAFAKAKEEEERLGAEIKLIASKSSAGALSQADQARITALQSQRDKKRSEIAAMKAKEPKRGKSHSATISSEGNPSLAPLDGMHTTPEIKEALTAVDSATMASYLRPVMAVNSAIKWGKVLGQPTAFMRNLASNITLSLANGHMPLWFKGEAWKHAFQRGGLAERKRLIRLGVLGEGVNTVEWNDYREALKKTPEELAKAQHGLLSSAKTGTEKLYSAADNLPKIMGFYAEEAALLDAGLSPKEAETLASDRIRDLYPTPARMPQALKTLRKSQFIFGQYFSFKAELLRTFMHRLKLIKSELASDNPKIRKMGAKRIMGSVIAHSAAPAAALTWRLLQGQDKEDDDDLREFVPEWDKDHELIAAGDPLKGQYVDLSDIDPTTMFTDPLMRIAAGDDLDETLIKWMKDNGEAFWGLSPVASLFVEAYTKETKEGRPIDDMWEHVWKEVRPGFLSWWDRASKDFGPDDVASFAIARTYDYDVEKALGKEISNYYRLISESSQRASRRIGRGKDERGARKEQEAERRKAFDDLSRKARAAMRLGVSSYKVEEMLDAQLSGEQTDAVLSGSYLPYEPPE